MSQHYRFRLPNWAKQGLIGIEYAMMPLMVYQLIRTILFPTTLDVFLLAIFVFLYISFYLKWF